jgi:hypothetical protein
MVGTRRLYSKPRGWDGITATCGRKPPSFPITIHGGPAVVGSGTPPLRPSVGQVGNAGFGTAGTILTSVGLAGSATYHCRLRVRSFPTLRMRKRTADAGTLRYGKAVPFTTIVSPKASPVIEGLGSVGFMGTVAGFNQGP